MNKKYCKTISLIILVAVIICTVAYAGHCSKKETLPSAALAVVETMYPNREMAKIEAEEASFVLYEVDFADGGSMMISAEGMVVSIETKESMQSIPSAVAKSISQSMQGANIKKVEKEVIYAVIKLVELGTPETIYEAKMKKDGSEIEIKIDPFGTIIDIEVEGNDEEDDDDDDDGDDEEHLSLDQVPAAVKATILKLSKSGEIEEIELENENGKILYEVEATFDGKEYELKISPDGDLLSKEVDDHDDDDDDDHHHD